LLLLDFLALAFQ
jgi:hypothetical protein